MRNEKTAYNFVWNMGCVVAIVEFVKNNIYPIAGTVIGIAVIQVCPFNKNRLYCCAWKNL